MSTCSTSAVELLERGQRHMYRNLCIEPNSLSRVEGAIATDHFTRLGVSEPQAARTTYLEELRRADASKPTPLEDPVAHHVMTFLARKIAAAAAKAGWSIDELPVFGTLPLNELNAKAMRVIGGDEHVIALQHGVFVFANQLTKAVAASFVKAGDQRDGYTGFNYELDEVERRWDRDSEPVHRFQALLSSYLVEGHPFAGQYFLDDPAHTALAAILRNSFELFIFGHEMGHIVAGHLRDGPYESLAAGPTAREELRPSWEMEFEADAIGCQLAIEAMVDDRYDVAMSYCGIDLTFTACEVVDRALAVLTRSSAERTSRKGASHPPPDQRKQMLRNGLSGVMSKQAAASFLRLANAGEEILNALWKRIEPHFAELGESGVQPARLWTA